MNAENGRAEDSVPTRTRVTSIQHYVPQFYLRKFAHKQGNTYFAYCYDKIQRVSYVQKVNRIACERQFYDSVGAINNETETAFSRLETRFNRAFSKLLQAASTRDIDNARSNMAFFLATQMLRTRTMRETILNILRDRDSNVLSDPSNTELVHSYHRATTDDGIKELHVQLIQSFASEIKAKFENMKWIILENGTEVPFWTSDHTVAPYDPLQHLGIRLQGFGLARQGLAVFFPLSSNRILSLWDAPQYQSDQQFVRVTRDSLVNNLNRIQLVWAARVVISKINNFSVATQFLDRHGS
jgi:hypothetical protein